MHKVSKKKIGKTRKTKLYNLYGGSYTSAEKYFNQYFENIMEKLEIDTPIQINNSNILEIEVNYKLFKKISNSYKKNESKLDDIKARRAQSVSTVNNDNTIKRMKDNGKKIQDIKKIIFNKIIEELNSITSNFFTNFFKNSYTKIENKTEANKTEFLNNIDRDENFVDKFTNIEKLDPVKPEKFLDEYIEWILFCYNNMEVHLDDTSLFTNYEKFLDLYTKIRLLIKNSQILLEIKNRELFLKLSEILKERNLINNTLQRDDIKQIIDRFKQTDEGKDIVNTIMKKYIFIRDNFQTNILGCSQGCRNKPITPYFVKLPDLIKFSEDYKEEIKNIKDILINHELKQIGGGKTNIQIIDKSDKLYIYKILTKAGSLLYGSNTSWCTATKSKENMFNHYHPQGDIYIIQSIDDINQRPIITNEPQHYDDEHDYVLQNSKDKFQLHVATSQLKNNLDIDVTVDYVLNYFNDEKLKSFFDKLLADTYVYKNNNSELIVTFSVSNRLVLDKHILERFNKLYENLSTHTNLLKLVLNNFNFNNFESNSFDYISVYDLFNKLTNLSSLSLKGNFILDKLLEKLTNLTSLNLSNSFDNELDDSLEKLTNLTSLSLEGNFILGKSLENLTNLTSLNLGNSFDNELDDSLNNLTNLTSLNLGNSFNKEIGTSLNNLKKLTHLSLGKEYTHSIQFLNDLPNITDLTLENLYSLQNLPKTIILKYITHLTFGNNFDVELYKVDLNNSLNVFVNLTNLIFGDKYNYPLGNSLNKLNKLTHLTFGNSFNCDLDDSLDELQNLTNLTFGNNFTQQLKFLDKLPKLQFLNINNIDNIEDLYYFRKPIKKNSIPKFFKSKLTIMFKGKPYMFEDPKKIIGRKNNLHSSNSNNSTNNNNSSSTNNNNTSSRSTSSSFTNNTSSSSTNNTSSRSRSTNNNTSSRPISVIPRGNEFKRSILNPRSIKIKNKTVQIKPRSIKIKRRSIKIKPIYETRRNYYNEEGEADQSETN